MNKRFLFFLTILIIASTTIILARAFRVNQIPNGQEKGCLNCHFSVYGGGPRNAFGQEIERNYLSTPGNAGQVLWGPALAALDSDGDGFTNGQELQDPDGNWSIGQPAPGDAGLVTSPGDANDVPVTTSIEAVTDIADAYRLEGNYPNPFNPSTTIRYVLPEMAQLRLEIHDNNGRRVRLLSERTMPAGFHATIWDGRDDNGVLVPSGTYFYRLTSDRFTATRRMLLMK